MPFDSDRGPVPPPDLAARDELGDCDAECRHSELAVRQVPVPSAAGAETVGIDLEVSGSLPAGTQFLERARQRSLASALYAVSSVTLNGDTASGASSSGIYTLQLQGDIYYSTGQQDVCSTAKTSGRKHEHLDQKAGFRSGSRGTSFPCRLHVEYN